MSAALKHNLRSENLSRKPPLGENRAMLRLVWENPQLSDYQHREKSQVQLRLVSGQTLYGYVFNDPVHNIDINGLWSVTVKFYAGLGGALSFGRNTDNGVGFASVDVGIGAGIRASYSWENKNPPGAIVDPCESGGASLGGFGELGGNLGPLKGGVGGEAGYSVPNNGNSDWYGDISGGGSATTSMGLGASGSFGIRGSVWN